VNSFDKTDSAFARTGGAYIFIGRSISLSGKAGSESSIIRGEDFSFLEEEQDIAKKVKQLNNRI